LTDLMRDEAGFTRADGENEVRRCVQTLELSAEEAKRISGELIPMDAASGMKDRLGFTIRVPRGVVCAITPASACMKPCDLKRLPTSNESAASSSTGSM
jgi:succinate-semialdehyde dehydrogenase/glutarate-semialdehyde dehydrogenase